MHRRHQAPELSELRTPAVAVAGGGLLVLLLGIVLRSRLLRVLGLIAALAGGGLYARQKVAERNKHIAEAQSHIRSELDDLDPIARAQVLAGLAHAKPAADT